MAPASPPDPSDHELLEAARAGDASALDALIVRYQSRVYRFGVRMCGDVEDARDVVQETSLAMARSLADFRADSSLSTWLYTIARRFCIKKRRRSKFAPRREESLHALSPARLDRLVAPSPTPEQELAGEELRAALDGAIASLDPAQREVLVLRDVEGLTAREVGDVLGTSVEAVKSRLHRARLAMRQALEPTVSHVGGPDDDGPCRDALALFSRHLEGDLDPRTCADMEAHTKQRGRCRDACQSLRRVLALCRSAPAPEVPDSVTQAVRAALRRVLAPPRS